MVNSVYYIVNTVYFCNEKIIQYRNDTGKNAAI